MDHAREKILENLSPSPVSVDELVRQCQVSLPLVLSVLLELELAGRLDRQPGHQVALIG
jgi:DNA processing protein